MLLRGLRESTERPDAEVILNGREPLLPPLPLGLSQIRAKEMSPPEDGLAAQALTSHFREVSPETLAVTPVSGLPRASTGEESIFQW